MAAPMRSSGWGYALIPGIYNFFEIGRQLRPSLIPLLYNVQGSARSKEENVGIGGISPDAWDNFANTRQKSTVSFDQGYLATYNHVTKVVSMVIERELMDDDQYGIIVPSRARKLGISAMQKMELDAASVFNNAFSSSYLGPDKKPLCSTTHPRNPNKTGNLVNAGTSALTKDAVKDTRIAMMNQVDDAGNKLGITPNMLLVPPDLEDAALEIANSVLDPGSANNAINPQAGRFMVQPWHQLTDSNNWFMIDTVWQRESLNWYTRTSLEITLTSETSTEAVYDAYMRYSYGWDDWRWVYGHEVANS